MVRRFFKSLHEIERRFARSFGTDIDTPRGRVQAWIHFYLFDHAFLRGIWTNQEQIAPGVWRSNQPSPARLRRLKKLGIKTILNLRGEDRYSFYLFEKEETERLGIALVDHKIYARSLVPRAKFLELFEIFDKLEKPFLLHCKSGADRAGLVSALWLLDQEGASVEEAKKMLSLRYVHLKSTRTGLMDAVLDAYEADIKDTPLSIRDWFATRYDGQALTRAFYDKMGWPKPETA